MRCLNINISYSYPSTNHWKGERLSCDWVPHKAHTWSVSPQNSSVTTYSSLSRHNNVAHGPESLKNALSPVDHFETSIEHTLCFERKEREIHISYLRNCKTERGENEVLSAADSCGASLDSRPRQQSRHVQLRHNPWWGQWRSIWRLWSCRLEQSELWWRRRMRKSKPVRYVLLRKTAYYSF